MATNHLLTEMILQVGGKRSNMFIMFTSKFGEMESNLTCSNLRRSPFQKSSSSEPTFDYQGKTVKFRGCRLFLSTELHTLSSCRLLWDRNQEWRLLQNGAFWEPHPYEVRRSIFISFFGLMLQLLGMKAYLQMFEKIHDHSTCTPVVRTLSGNNGPRTSIYKTDLGRTWSVFHHACLLLVDQMIQFDEHSFFRLPDVGWKKSFWPAAISFGTNLRPRMPVTNEAVGWDSRTKKCNPGVTITGVVVYIQTISFHPNIFQKGWSNHQLDDNSIQDVFAS